MLHCYSTCTSIGHDVHKLLFLLVIKIVLSTLYMHKCCGKYCGKVALLLSFQTPLDEYDYAVTNLAVDLRDGLRLV